MKVLLTFFTIVLFSFNAKASTNTFGFYLCSNAESKATQYYREYYLVEEKKKKGFVLKREEKNSVALDKSYKYASIYNAFCKK